MDDRYKRPYLVIPKLIEQPTWGGAYIAKTKSWQDRPELRGKKIGQSYEIFSGSNLSLLADSDDPDFFGELHDRDSAQRPTSVPNSLSLAELAERSPAGVLGAEVVRQRGGNIDLLAKFTQALGNSFQIHPKDSQNDPYWKPKPESWYFFEPGIITLGAKKGADWEAYRAAVEAVDAGMRNIGGQIQAGNLTHEQAKPKIHALIAEHDPWRFVNLVNVPKDGVVDASVGGLHHSWEEDARKIPLGNVLYELQTETMDDVSTLRSFDKGKMGEDGSLRDVHIQDYFRLIDRSPETNDPAAHMREPKVVATGEGYALTSLLRTKYYSLGKLTFVGGSSKYAATITQFEHLFVQSGRVIVTTSAGNVSVGAGHSCFVPAAAGEYAIVCKSPSAEVLMSK